MNQAEAAEGDAALLKRQIAAWSERDERSKQAEKPRFDAYQSRSMRLRQQFTAADSRYRNAVGERRGHQVALKHLKSKYDQLAKKIDPSVPFGNFTDREKAAYQVLERKIMRYKSDIRATDAECGTARASRDGAEKLIELEHKRHEQAVDDDRPAPNQPRRTFKRCRSA